MPFEKLAFIPISALYLIHFRTLDLCKNSVRKQLVYGLCLFVWMPPLQAGIKENGDKRFLLGIIIGHSVLVFHIAPSMAPRTQMPFISVPLCAGRVSTLFGRLLSLVM